MLAVVDAVAALQRERLENRRNDQADGRHDIRKRQHDADHQGRYESPKPDVLHAPISLPRETHGPYVGLTISNAVRRVGEYGAWPAPAKIDVLAGAALFVFH